MHLVSYLVLRSIDRWQQRRRARQLLLAWSTLLKQKLSIPSRRFPELPDVTQVISSNKVKKDYSDLFEDMGVGREFGNAKENL
jgi:hypothetical protein